MRPLLAEQRIYNTALGYAGTVDLVAYVSDRLTIVDYKTSKAVYAEYRLQIAAYRAAYRNAETNGLILRFPKDRGDAFEVADVPWAEQERLLAVFLAAKRVWEWMA